MTWYPCSIHLTSNDVCNIHASSSHISISAPPAMLPQTKTVALFHEDPYRTEAEVWVDALAVDERFGPYVMLSETVCHPHGGGQKGDRACLLLPAEVAVALRLTDGTEPAEAVGGATSQAGAALPIVDTRKDGGRILHLIGPGHDAAALEECLVGTRAFTLQLDWDFRLRQMRLHSAAHLLHCMMERELDRKVPDPQTSDLQPEQGLNRYEIADLVTPEQMESIVAALNTFTAEGHVIRTTPDAQRAGFRHWQCEDWVIPCGGTHPTTTAEIGSVTVNLSLKRGRTSMTFRLVE